MRPAALLLLALVAAACTSSGERERTLSAVVGAVTGAIAGPAAPPREPGVSRARLDAIEGPLISVRRGDGPRVFVRAAAVNRGDLVTYVDTARHGLTLRGGAINGTDGFGFDLIGIAAQTDDPLVVATPPDRWPETVTRAYKFHRRDLPTESMTFRCRLSEAGPASVQIVGESYDLVMMRERCTNGRIEFENRHWVAPDTGFVWKSTQWIGPRASPLTYEVIHPHDPA